MSRRGVRGWKRRRASLRLGAPLEEQEPPDLPRATAAQKGGEEIRPHDCSQTIFQIAKLVPYRRTKAPRADQGAAAHILGPQPFCPRRSPCSPTSFEKIGFCSLYQHNRTSTSSTSFFPSLREEWPRLLVPAAHSVCAEGLRGGGSSTAPSQVVRKQK